MDPIDSIIRCPITHSIMLNPVITSNGRTFEKFTIKKWILKEGSCPITREKLTTALLPNHGIRGFIESYLLEHPEKKSDQFELPPVISEDIMDFDERDVVEHIYKLTDEEVVDPNIIKYVFLDNFHSVNVIWAFAKRWTNEKDKPFISVMIMLQHLIKTCNLEVILAIIENRHMTQEYLLSGNSDIQKFLPQNIFILDNLIENIEISYEEFELIINAIRKKFLIENKEFISRIKSVLTDLEQNLNIALWTRKKIDKIMDSK